LLYSKWLRGSEPASKELLEKIGKQYVIEWVDEAHPLWQSWQDEMINAAYDPKTKRMLFRRDVTHIEALEEFLHHTQGKIPKLADVVDNYPLYELHVKDFMIRHRQLLGISAEDARTLQQMLIRQIESRVDMFGNPLRLPDSATIPIH
jgi:hypothetical protein